MDHPVPKFLPTSLMEAPFRTDLVVGHEEECLIDDVLQLGASLEDIVAGRIVPASHHRQQPVE